MTSTRFFLFLAAILLSLPFVSCEGDNVGANGSFSYTVSGAASASVSGENPTTGSLNGVFSIGLNSNPDELTIRIIIDPLVEGTYNINPEFVNGNVLPLVERDVTAELGIGSSLGGGRQSFNTASADGGTVTISKVSDSEIEGSFSISMMELLSGTPPHPKVQVSGEFKAKR